MSTLVIRFFVRINYLCAYYGSDHGNNGHTAESSRRFCIAEPCNSADGQQYQCKCQNCYDLTTPAICKFFVDNRICRSVTVFLFAFGHCYDTVGGAGEYCL